MITQEVLKEIGEWAAKAAEYGTANFALFNEGSTELLEKYQDQACHWNLKKCRGSDYMVSLFKSKTPTSILGDDVCRKYVKYMLESPWFFKYVETSPDEAWDKRYFIVNGEIDANVNIFLCISSRQLWEYPQVVKKTVCLCDRGLPFANALALANIVKEKNGMVSFSTFTSGHNPLPGSLDKSQYKNLILVKSIHRQKGKDSWQYRDWFSSLVSDGRSKSLVAIFIELCRKVNCDYVHPFPLLASVEVEQEMTVEDFYNEAVKFHEEVVLELQNEAA